MRRQYIDFVPVNNRQIQQEEPPVPVVHAIKVSYIEDLLEPTDTSEAPVIEEAAIAESEKAPEPATEPATIIDEFLDEPSPLNEKLFVANSTPEYGVIEDYEPPKNKQKSQSIPPKPSMFKAANVEKRPLSAPHHFVSKKAMQDITSAKAEKISKKPLDLSKKPVEKSVVRKETEDFKTPFINRNVEKRPLSKTVYPPKTVKVSEELSGPVTIINKPEKDAHINLVIAILLTIILGAAVGTIAFLLLPR